MKIRDAIAIKNRRPLSPHLQIYKPQITSVLSITHRITGFIQYVTQVILIWSMIGFVYYGSDPGAEYEIPSMFSINFTKTIFILWLMTFIYHILNGIRHLFWDIGLGFSIKTSERTGIVVIFLTLMLTYFVWTIILS